MADKDPYRRHISTFELNLQNGASLKTSLLDLCTCCSWNCSSSVMHGKLFLQPGPLKKQFVIWCDVTTSQRRKHTHTGLAQALSAILSHSRSLTLDAGIAA